MAKIKHWQGYGSLDVKKLAEYNANSTGSKKKVVIQVSGNHEYGVVREDPYDVHRWLGKRFFPDCDSYRDITDLNVIPGTGKDKAGCDVDTAIYEITYWAQ